MFKKIQKIEKYLAKVGLIPRFRSEGTFNLIYLPEEGDEELLNHSSGIYKLVRETKRQEIVSGRNYNVTEDAIGFFLPTWKKERTNLLIFIYKVRRYAKGPFEQETRSTLFPKFLQRRRREQFQVPDLQNPLYQEWENSKNIEKVKEVIKNSK